MTKSRPTPRAAPKSAAKLAPSNYEKIYAIVKRIPKGRVATYGQVAALAGVPRGARQVGYALHRCPVGASIPWQRVVNSRGEISARSEARGAESLQLKLLRAEGVELDPKGRIDLKRFQWKPKGTRGQKLTRVGSGSDDELPVDLDKLV